MSQSALAAAEVEATAEETVEMMFLFLPLDRAEPLQSNRRADCRAHRSRAESPMFVLFPMVSYPKMMAERHKTKLNVTDFHKKNTISRAILSLPS